MNAKKATTVAQPLQSIKVGGMPTKVLFNIALTSIEELAKRQAEEAIADDLHGGCFEWRQTMLDLVRINKSLNRARNAVKDMVYDPLRD
jgi:hypothetical protein